MNPVSLYDAETGAFLFCSNEDRCSKYLLERDYTIVKKDKYQWHVCKKYFW